MRFSVKATSIAVAIFLSACGGSDDSPAPSPTPTPEPNPNVPVISSSVQEASTLIAKDPEIQKIVAHWKSEDDARARFDTHLELTRIASPSRFEYRRVEEISKRLVNEWGFSNAEVATRADGYLPGAGLQTVDGLPVYNVCSVIKGTYSTTSGAQSFNGQYPKVLIEGHIDTVNPEEMPPDSAPYMPVKLQPIAEPIISSPAELAALKDEVNFDSQGRIIRDANYERAYRRFANAEAATKGGADRLYVPGYIDAMGNATMVFQIAKMLKTHNIKPVYDMWFCGTAGEEGKGNLAGMKQLYGYSQDTGKGNNALNFVTNFSIDGGSGTINFIGSYRFEMKFKAPANPTSGASAVTAAALAGAKISDILTPWDKDNKALKTTYTIGTASCEAPDAAGITPSCTLQVDMRSPRLEPLNDIRAQIEPLFAAGLEAENERASVVAGSPDAVSMELVWFGDRPPHERTNLSDVSIQAAWQAAEIVGVDKRAELSTGASSLNDNVPAAIGVPTINLNAFSTAASGGTHAFYEWGIPGSSDTEALRMYRIMMAGLIASGYTTSDGKTVAPAADPIGARTTTDMYK